MGMIRCSCGSGDASACKNAIPCGCDCHRSEEVEIVPVKELERLRLIERAAAHYRFAGSMDSLAFLKKRGWADDNKGRWIAPNGYPVAGPKSFNVALAVELELSLGLHQ